MVFLHLVAAGVALVFLGVVLRLVFLGAALRLLAAALVVFLQQRFSSHGHGCLSQRRWCFFQGRWRGLVAG